MYLDTNANGVCDKGEQGLAQIPVSNGRDITLTDARGSYTLPLSEGQAAFPILPAEYTLSQGKALNAAFAQVYPDAKGRRNFGLKGRKVQRKFRLNAIGDIQVGNSMELNYLCQTLWPELMEADSACTNLFLGDLVNNNLALYKPIRQLIEALPSPSWTLPGNHDRDADTLRWRQTRSYSATFGPPAYAFNQGDVHFIVLNNVYGDGARGYHGEIDRAQLDFIKADLQLVPKHKLVCIATHIPLATTRNRNHVLDLLAGRKQALALSGHLHRVHRWLYSKPGISVHELGTGAACGFWWVGERGWDGVPSALQQGGTPRNYFVIDFDSTAYHFRVKGIGLDRQRQMAIHIAGIDTLDSHLRDLKEAQTRRALITIWGGCDATEVLCRVDKGPWQAAIKVEEVAPDVARTREMNLIKAYPTPYNRTNPMRAKPSVQLWAYPLTGENATGAHTIEVKAQDDYGLRAGGKRAYTYP